MTTSELKGGPARDKLVARYLELLRAAEVLVIVHPNWWGAPPAMMKGWMDRVFAEGSAYVFDYLHLLSRIPHRLCDYSENRSMNETSCG